MRQGWTRGEPEILLTRAQLARLVSAAFPRDTLVSARLATGGLSNTTYSLRLLERDRSVRLRIYNRGRSVGALEQAIGALIPAGVPRPRVLHVGLDAIPPHAFLEDLAGSTLDVACTRLTREALLDTGRQLGATLARIHSRRFEQTGFFDETLAIARPFDASGRGLVSFAHRILYEERGRERVSRPLRDRLFAWLQSAAGLLDDGSLSRCLTHGDFGASNILVRCSRDGRCAEIAAILDWEYACSGIPLFDLANLLRPPLGDTPGFDEAVADGYRQAGGSLPDNWQPAMRVADMFAWLELLGRPRTHATVVSSLCRSITRLLDQMPAAAR